MPAHTAMRLAASAVLLGLVSVGTTGAAVAAEKSAGNDESSAQVLKTGWWWKANGTPLDQTAAAPPQTAPPNVPKTALPVAAVLGEPEKMSAIEFVLDAKSGSSVTSAVLVLPESTASGANANSAGAAVVACPVTEAFWADGPNGAWATKPAYDCKLAQAAGERGENGEWTFDLTSVAALWLAEGFSGSPSVALVEAADAPSSFQVSFDTAGATAIGLSLVTSGGSGGGDGTDGEGTGGEEPDGTGTGTSGGTGAGTGSGGSTGGTGDSGFTPVSSGSDTGSFSPPADVPLGDLPVASGPVPAETPADAPLAAGPDTLPVAAPAYLPPWYAGIPKGGMVLLPFVLGLAYLAMLALGPDAQPAAVTTTQRGVSRALERFRRAGASVGQMTQMKQLTSKARKGTN